MKYKLVAIAFTITLLLLAGRPALAQNGTPEDQMLGIIQVYAPDDEISPQVQRQAGPPAVPWTDFAVHGTSLVAESRSSFSSFTPKGWGMVTRAKAAGQQWVHFSIPLITYLEDVAQYINHVEFCAKSTNGASTKPIQMDLYASNVMFYSGSISWPANNNKYCAYVNISPTWREDLGISILVYYANTTASVTFYKAWARTER